MEGSVFQRIKWPRLPDLAIFDVCFNGKPAKKKGKLKDEQ